MFPLGLEWSYFGLLDALSPNLALAGAPPSALGLLGAVSSEVEWVEAVAALEELR